ncbi:enolase C-terminal domain-like protein [Agromyces silvae]|uniref:enolase C-terminal domain-like protein n=1 Tax=Agromyces silvae TaxID=3388266 RepID=UPI00280A5377|nr:enolase C-terminal domain-like protein [Agromyces protaetiae]
MIDGRQHHDERAAARERIAPGYTQQDSLPPVPWDDGEGVRISGLDVFVVAPDGVNLVVVRVRTTTDGLVGWGCATFTQRAFAVASVIETYLAPLVTGRSVHDITDVWLTTTVDSYWRGGPVLNSALSGIDQALWDIKGKLAGVPVWQLLGGRVRTVAEAYTHASGRDVAELADQVEQCIEAGYRHVRCQITVPGTATYGAAQQSSRDVFWDPDAYVRLLPRVFEGLAERFGGRVRLIHDIHERLAPADAVGLVRALEPYDLLFVEDPVAPEDVEWLRRIRESTTVPLAFGELITDPARYLPLMSERLIDFVRCHISAIGGLTPAIRLASLAEAYGVRTAWHGPRDVSPIGHAANLALDIASPAFGIHEHFEFSDAARELFPGTPVTVDGALAPTEGAGLGVELDERGAAAHPPVSATTNWHYSRVRRRDGASQRP